MSLNVCSAGFVPVRAVDGALVRDSRCFACPGTLETGVTDVETFALFVETGVRCEVIIVDSFGSDSVPGA
jgi:hypothetical protein